MLPARLNKKNQPLSASTLHDYNNQIEHLQNSTLSVMNIGFIGSSTHRREARKAINHYLDKTTKDTHQNTFQFLPAFLRIVIPNLPHVPGVTALPCRLIKLYIFKRAVPFFSLLAYLTFDTFILNDT